MTTPNTSTQVETITAPTNIKLEFFSAQRGKDKTGADRVVLLWKTGAEAHNLGFNVYREQGGERIPLNSSLIAGSALLMSGALPKHSGKTYSWIDSSANAGSGPYWLEDVDVNGTRILHGPVSPAASTNAQLASDATSAVTVNQLNQAQPAAALTGVSHPVENVLPDTLPTVAQQQKQFELAATSRSKNIREARRLVLRNAAATDPSWVGRECGSGIPASLRRGHRAADTDHRRLRRPWRFRSSGCNLFLRHRNRYAILRHQSLLARGGRIARRADSPFTALRRFESASRKLSVHG